MGGAAAPALRIRRRRPRRHDGRDGRSRRHRGQPRRGAPHAPPRQAVSLLWKRPQVSGSGRSGPLPRRHGRLFPHRSNRDRRLRPRHRFRSAEPKHCGQRQDRQSPRVSGHAVRPALRHARTGRRRRHRLRALRRAWTHEILVADFILALPEIGIRCRSPSSTRASSSKRSRTATSRPPPTRSDNRGFP